MQLVDWLGLFAGGCTTIAIVPQAARTIRLRETGQLSLTTYLLLSLGFCSWVGYGFLVSSTPIIIANSISLPFALTILILKIGDRTDV